jgi:hypothetical protein
MTKVMKFFGVKVLVNGEGHFVSQEEPVQKKRKTPEPIIDLTHECTMDQLVQAVLEEYRYARMMSYSCYNHYSLHKKCPMDCPDRVSPDRLPQLPGKRKRRSKTSSKTETEVMKISTTHTNKWDRTLQEFYMDCDV